MSHLQLYDANQLQLLNGCDLGYADMMGIDAYDAAQYDAAQYGVDGIYTDLTDRLEGTVVGTVVFILQLIRPLSAIAAGYHGYKRNCDRWSAALGWGALGFLFPVITPTVALAQGFGKDKGRC